MLVILLIITFFIPPIQSLNCLEETKSKSLAGIEFLAGFGWGKLQGQGNYHLAPFLVNFDFDLKPFLQKLNLNPRQLCQFQIEPFISFVSSPHANIETGTSFLFKMGVFPQTLKFQPYIKIGGGMVYMTQHTREQSTQFNFIEQIGAGIHYFFQKNAAFILEGRFRHLSNSSMRRPNRGVETCFVVTGISYQF